MIHVNSHKIRQNQKQNQKQPVITVKKWGDLAEQTRLSPDTKLPTPSVDSSKKGNLNIYAHERPDVVSPGGNAYGEEMTATCLRDLDYYLRLITYGIVAGDTTPIEEIGIVGVQEMYKSLGTPIDAVKEGVRAMKSVATGLLSGDDAAEAGAYFDYVIGEMS